MTQADIDLLNAHLEREHEMETNRFLNGQCACCGGTFLMGLKDALVIDGHNLYYECFWCCDMEGYDPSDPQPSRFRYGNC
jgi:hypothetical protein